VISAVLFPGSLALIVLLPRFSHHLDHRGPGGLLQGVLASPAPRAAIVLGKAG
jgi:hypothetical protein